MKYPVTIVTVALLAGFSMVGTPKATSSFQAGDLVIRQLTDSTDCGSEYPAFEASGNQVAFESNCDWIAGGNTDHSSEVFVIDVDGSGLVQATSGTGGNMGNVWVNASGKK